MCTRHNNHSQNTYHHNTEQRTQILYYTIYFLSWGPWEGGICSMGFSISECFSTRGTSYPNARLLLEVAISLAFLLLVGDLQEELLSSEKRGSCRWSGECLGAQQAPCGSVATFALFRTERIGYVLTFSADPQNGIYIAHNNGSQPLEREMQTAGCCA